MKDGSFSITTDCNNAGGNYSEKDKKISFGSIFITEMYCEGSQEKDFIKGLEQVESYYFTSLANIFQYKI
jgi:heat shock protein HslJ